MKLIIAIVNNDDSATVAAALTREKFTVTKLSTSGGFLMVGNTTLLIGTDDDKTELAKEIIKTYSHTRTKSASTTESFGRGFVDGEIGSEIKISGATVFVLDVVESEKF